MSPKFKHNPGFSLIEMMITIAIFLIISSATFLTLATGRTFWYSGKTQLGIAREARQGLNYMAAELRQAKADTVVPVAGDSINISFKIPTDSSGTLLALISYSLDVNSKQLRRQPSKVVGRPYDVLANNITGLNFQRNNKIIKIRITSQKQTTQNYTISTTLETEVNLRN